MVKYEVPSILLIDVDKVTQEGLRNDGFNIDIGTFGSNYAVGGSEECGFNCSLPLLAEKDIIIVDMNTEYNKLGYNTLRNQQWVNGDKLTYIPSRGSIWFNPSYLSAYNHRLDLKNIVNRGGVIIVFADKISEETYYPIEFKNGIKNPKAPIKISNFEWLNNLNISSNNCVSGKEIYFNENVDEVFKSIFKDCENEVLYKITLGYEAENHMAICRNKSGDVIAKVAIYGKEDNVGFLIILPQFKSIYKPVINLFQDVLPVLKTELFPSFAKNNWLNDEDYILPEVKQLNEIKEKEINKYEKKLKEIDEQIIHKKLEYNYLTGLLISNAYDDLLVNNVIETLKLIGYNDVINVDDITEGNRQEDLRILDGGQLTIIEVKGHNGNPTEDDCHALVKYMGRNMRQENRTDIHGILIINHHKLKAPLDRPNPAFTEPQISDAIGDNCTLVSTWELYKSVRLLQKGLISFDDIDAGLHSKGLYTALPSPWHFLGKIQHQYVNGTIACFYLEADSIRVGDELIISNGNNYFKIDVGEMRVNNEIVYKSIKGDELAVNIGISILKQASIYVKNKKD